ncbi:MAG: glycosyltransferase [Lentisphaeria bacterium]|nr:glycosyltransferase [Lentisphaeria bacterium]
MKIVFVLTEIAIGGAERVVLNICTELQKKGHETAVCALKNLCHEDLMVQAFQRENIHLVSLNADKKHPWRLLKLGRLVKSLNPDCVSAHLFHPNILSRLLLKKRSFKLINTIHIMEIRKSQKWRFVLDKMTFKMADVHTAVSQAAADFQQKMLKLPENSFKVIRNGIDIPRKLADDEKKALRQKWGVAGCDIVFGCVGRLNHQKGFDILLGMKELLSRKFAGQKIGLVFIGDGPEKENLLLQAANPPENMKIVFAGYSAQAASECGAFDVFLMPSRFEGLPLSLIEATANNLRIVAQNIPSVAEVVNEYPNAFLADFAGEPEKTVEKIADALQKTPAENIRIYTTQDMTAEYLKVFSKSEGSVLNID